MLRTAVTLLPGREHSTTPVCCQALWGGAGGNQIDTTEMDSEGPAREPVVAEVQVQVL